MNGLNDSLKDSKNSDQTEWIFDRWTCQAVHLAVPQLSRVSRLKMVVEM